MLSTLQNDLITANEFCLFKVKYYNTEGYEMKLYNEAILDFQVSYYKLGVLESSSISGKLIFVAIQYTICCGILCMFKKI